MANGWTPERRARQAQLIRRWRPWEQSTGPKTAESKAKSSRNADKGAQAVDALRALGAEAHSLPVEMSDIAAVQAMGQFHHGALGVSKEE